MTIPVLYMDLAMQVIPILVQMLKELLEVAKEKKMMTEFDFQMGRFLVCALETMKERKGELRFLLM